MSQRNIEIITLAIIACALASTLAVVPVWIGVLAAYVAFMKSCNMQVFAIVQRNGYTLINCNVAPGISLCLVASQAQRPQYNVWQLQGASA